MNTTDDITARFDAVIARYTATGRYTGEVEKGKMLYTTMLNWINEQLATKAVSESDHESMLTDHRDSFTTVVDALSDGLDDDSESECSSDDDCDRCELCDRHIYESDANCCEAPGCKVEVMCPKCSFWDDDKVEMLCPGHAFAKKK
jgi:hypothetical protein